MMTNIDSETKKALANFLGSTLRKTKELETATIESSNGAKSAHDAFNVINKAASEIDRMSGPAEAGPPPNYPPLESLPSNILPIPELIPLPEDMQQVEDNTNTEYSQRPTFPSNTIWAESRTVSEEPQLELPLTTPQGNEKIIIDELDRINRKLDRILKYIKDNSDEINNSKQK